MSDGPSLVIVSDLHLGGGPAAGAWGAGFSDEFADDGGSATSCAGLPAARAAAPTSAKLFRWTGAAELLADRTVPA